MPTIQRAMVNGAVCAAVLWSSLPPSGAAAQEDAEAAAAEAGSGEAARDRSSDGVDPALAEAQRRFERGVSLYNAGDFRTALFEFEQSYEAFPNFRILYNIGQTRLTLHDYGGAVRAFERYLREGGDEVLPDRQSGVREELERLASLTGHVRVRATEEGARVLIDDEPVGETPLAEPHTVSVGRHVVEVGRSGFLTSREVVRVSAGETVEVSAVLERPVPPSRAAPDLTPFWVAGGATLAVAIAATASGIVTLEARASYDEERQTIPASPERIDAARDRAENLALVTDILLGLTAVGATISAVLLYDALAADEPRRDAPSTSVAAGATPSGGFIGVQGRFR